MSSQSSMPPEISQGIDTLLEQSAIVARQSLSALPVSLPANTIQPPGTASVTSSALPRATWTPAQKHFLLLQLVQAQEAGKSSDNSYKKEVWNEILREFNPHFGCNYDADQLKTQYNALKQEYKRFKMLSKNVSGFGWDDNLQQLTAPEPVWQEVMKANKWAKRFHHSTLPNKELMQQLFDAVVATGSFAVSSVSEQANAARSRATTTSSESSNTLLNASPGPDTPLLAVGFDATVELTTPSRSQSPKKRQKKENGLSQLSRSIDNSVKTMSSFRNELNEAISQFVIYAKSHSMSTRTKVICKQIISCAKNATVFLALETDEYKDWFELMFEQGHHGAFIAVSQPLEEGLVGPVAPVEAVGDIVQQQVCARSLSSLAQESDDEIIP